MKTLHLDGIGGRAKPQFLRGRCYDNIGCEKRIDRRSSALNGKFHKRVVAHHDLICVVAFNGLRHQHGSDRVLSFQTPCQTGHDKEVRTFFEQFAHRSKVSPAYSREHDVNSGTVAVRRVHACGRITYAFKISQSSPRSELGTNCKTDDCPPLSHWERAARQLNRSWRAGWGLQVDSNLETLTLPSPRGRGWMPRHIPIGDIPIHRARDCRFYSGGSETQLAYCSRPIDEHFVLGHADTFERNPRFTPDHRAKEIFRVPCR